jgi:hypothetical protein
MANLKACEHLAITNFKDGVGLIIKEPHSVPR